jgi:hypothetical protein
MEHDSCKGTHSHPGYQHTTHTTENEGYRQVCVLASSSPLFSDSDLTEERPPRKIWPQRPREATHRPMPNIDSSRRRLADQILKTSSEEMCRTSAKDLHDQSTPRRSSLPLKTAAPISQSRVEHAETRSRLTRSCCNQFITHHRRRCCANHHADPCTYHRSHPLDPQPIAQLTCTNMAIRQLRLRLRSNTHQLSLLPHE